MTETAPAAATSSSFYARGVLHEQSETDTGAQIVMTIPETSYQLHLNTLKLLDTEIGKRLVGTIRMTARRVDVVRTGGSYLEPVYGRPRRAQGRVIATNTTAGTITLDAGVPVECTLADARQNAGDFNVGDYVTFGVMAGATFTPKV